MFLPNVVTSAATCTVSADYKRQSQAQDMYLVEKSRCDISICSCCRVPAPLLRTAVKARGLPGCPAGNPPFPSPCTESRSHPAPCCFQPQSHCFPPRSPKSQHFPEFSLCPRRPLRPRSAALGQPAPAAGSCPPRGGDPSL